MAEEIKKIVTIDTNKSPESIKELRDQIKTLKDQLISLDETSQEYAETLSKVSKKAFELRELQENVRYSAADLGEALTGLNKVASGIASGFGAAKGLMALFGTQSEALEKTMVKLQGTIALVQGLQGLEGLSKDLKRAKMMFSGLIAPIKASIVQLSAFKKALLATGIGAAVVLLGELIANWDELSKAINPLGGQLDILTGKFESENAVIQTQVELMGVAGKTIEEQLIVQIQALESQLAQLQELHNKQAESSWISWIFGGEKDYDKTSQEINDLTEKIGALNQKLIVERAKRRKDEADAGVKEIEERKKAATQAYDTEKKKAESILEASQTANKAEIERLTSKYEQEKALLEKFHLDTTALTQEYEANKADIQKKEAEKALKQQIDNSGKVIDQLNDDLNKIETIYSQKSFYAQINAEIKANQQDNDFISQMLGGTSFKSSFPNLFDLIFGGGESQKAEIEAQYQDELATILSIYDPIIQGLEEKKAALETALKNPSLIGDDRIAVEREFTAVSNELTRARIDKANEELIAEQKNAAKEKSINELRKKSFASLGSSVASICDSMASVLGEESEAGKGFAAASATIQALLAANEAYSSLASIPYVGPALGAAAAAAALIAGFANVKKILSVNSDGSNASSSMSEGGSVTVAPAQELLTGQNFEYTRNILGNSEVDELNKSQKVYVLESDIEDTVRKVNVAEQQSTF